MAFFEHSNIENSKNYYIKIAYSTKIYFDIRGTYKPRRKPGETLTTYKKSLTQNSRSWPMLFFFRFNLFGLVRVAFQKIKITFDILVLIRPRPFFFCILYLMLGCL